MGSIKLKVINNSSKLYRVRLDRTSEKVFFKENDRVMNKENNVLGTIKSLKKNAKISWDDNTEEEIKLSQLSKKVAYVDYAEQQISPMNTQQSVMPESNSTLQMEKIKNNESKTPKKVNNNPLAGDDVYKDILSEMNDTFDDIEDANPNKCTERKKIKQIKVDSTDELIALMKTKQMIRNSSQEKKYREQIMKMNDEEYEDFKNDIINKKEPELTEAEIMLKKIKGGGAIIGDFSSEIGNSNNGFDDHSFGDPIDFSQTSKTRKLSASNKTDYDPQDNMTMDNFLDNLQNSDFNMNTERKLNFDGFKNIEGLKNPIQIQNDQRSSRQTLADAIGEIDWTILSKK